MSGSHDPKQWNRQWSLVHRALELPDDAARQAFLEAECMDDPVLRREIEDLMQAAAQAGDFLATPPTDPNRPQIKREEVAADSGWIGRRIGRYTIRRRIAAGGMGVVFEAVQERPKRAVALKIMRGGITSRSAMRRFEYEAQTLARLRHPHIAQIFEAGTHDDGRGALPYFAMEYVPNARTLIEFALERKLGTRERIELFRRVCDAVHHGHQRGIIHRDLKPSNILVDSNGDPKVIDFGVARATDSDLAVTTLQTDVGQLIGTLQYMSPEQCDADPHDLDTRSDVYALGVVLYELLTEEAPYDVTTVPLFEAPRIIKTTPPRRPSTFSRTVRGDLETVLMKALEKERERRYQTAAEFAQDLQRYLHQEPIIARPASASYQMQMFVRRHRPIVAAGSVAVAALVIATVVSTVFGIAQQQALTREREANEAADQARLEREQGVRAAVATLVLALQDASGVNADGDRNEEKNNMARLAAFRESLEAAAAQMLSRFEGDPIGQAEILAGVANGLRQGGLFEIAEPYIRDAVEKRTSAAPLDARGLGLMLQHAYLLIDLGRFPEAKEIISTAMTADIEWSESFQEELLNLRSLYLWTSSDEREADEVVADYRNLAADFEAFWGDEHRNALWQLNLAARVYARAGEPEKSIALYRDVIRHADRHPDMGPLDGWTWAWRGNMAASMIDAGRCEEAEVILSMLVEQAEEEIEGLSDHPDGVRTRNLWAKALACLDRREDAIALWEEAIVFGEAAEGFPVHYTAAFKRSLGEYLVEWGQAERAIPLLREAEAVYVAQQGEDNEDVARVRRALDAAREALDDNP